MKSCKFREWAELAGIRTIGLPRDKSFRWSKRGRYAMPVFFVGMVFTISNFGAGCPGGVNLLGANWELVIGRFGGNLNPGDVLEPGQEVDLVINGLTVPQNEAVVWVGDYLRVPLSKQIVQIDNRQTEVAPRITNVASGEPVRYRIPLPILNPGTYQVAVGDMDGPLSNSVSVEVGAPQRRVSQAEAAQIWEDGIRELIDRARQLTHQTDPTWQHFLSEQYDASQMNMINGIYSECDALAQVAGTEYQALDPIFERQLQAYLWNSGLLHTFDALVKEGAGSVSAKGLASASVSFSTDGVDNRISRRLVHRTLFRLDALGAKILALNSVIDVANAVALITGGEGLVITVPVTIVAQSIRLMFDAVFPTELKSLELHNREILPNDLVSYQPADFNNRWLYWGTFEPPISLSRGLIRFTAGMAGLGVGNVAFPLQAARRSGDAAIDRLIEAGILIFRPLFTRMGLNILTLVEGFEDRTYQFEIKTVVDTAMYTHFLESTGIATDAAGQLADYLINVATDPSLTATSLTAPQTDVDGWREPDEEHFAFRHPGVASGQTDDVEVALTAFNLGSTNIWFMTVPVPEFLPTHTATIQLVHRSDWDRVNPPIVFFHDVMGPNPTEIERLTGAVVRASSPMHRAVAFRFSRTSPLRIQGNVANNQGFRLDLEVNGSTGALSFNSSGMVDVDASGGLSLQPGFNRLMIDAVNLDPNAAGLPVDNVQFTFPFVVDPQGLGGRAPRRNAVVNLGPGRVGPVEMHIWVPPAI